MYRYRWIVAVVLAGVVLWVLLVPLRTADRQPPARPDVQDFRRHPVYATYEFPADANVVRLGTQPFWIFAGNVLEIMSRDRILRRQLEQQGLEVRFYHFLKGADLNFFVRQGDLDGGICGDMATLTVASAVELTVPALTDQGYDDIVAREAMLVADLKGKRIASAFGSSTHHTLLEALAEAGIRPDQVELVPMDITEMSDALASGEVDACGSWEPFTPEILKNNPESAVIHRGRYLGFLYFRKEFADRHPEAVRRLLAAQVRASRWMLSSRDHILLSSLWAVRAGGKLSQAGSVPSPEHYADAILRVGEINRVPLIPERFLQPNEKLHREFNFLKALGKIPPAAEWARIRGMFDRRLVLAILARPAEFALEEFDYDTGGKE